jgi:antitoxin VapB
MALLIKDPETDRIVRELAERTGESLTEAVKVAAKQRLDSLPSRPRGRVDRAALARLQAELAMLPKINEDKTDEELLGYNDEGHFD